MLDSLPAPVARAVKAALVQAISLLQAQDFAGADAKLTAAEKVVNALAERKAAAPEAFPPEQQAAPADAKDPGPEEAAGEWAARLAALAPLVAAAEKAGKGDVPAILRAFAYAKAQGDAGRYDAALRAADATEALIDQARKAPDDAEAAETGEAPALSEEEAEAFDNTRLEWTKTRSGLQAELIKLKMAIDAHTRGVEGLEDISNQTDLLLDYIEELDTTLQDKLNGLVKTGDGVQRRKLAEEARQIMTEYRGVLDTDFFKAVDGNGFVSTTIRDTALTALGEVESALTA